ncbi:hypothetical protein F511_46816 [Dorcoceras hygrometricum]|uniref:Uncharacterized protein n=1 Tax=Dorcoceras hygrometricum TaxID=472368 RepID=A0A2Z6ZT56_9LAMI|nr:hypothetical protein F511_46816 [Dorcoceras hygrometricum]
MIAPLAAVQSRLDAPPAGRCPLKRHAADGFSSRVDCTPGGRNAAPLLASDNLRWPHNCDEGWTIVVRRCGVLVARKRAGRATLRATSCAAVRFFSCGGRRPAASPASLDDVVTAGLNSFRFWFGPVPGRP